MEQKWKWSDERPDADAGRVSEANNKRGGEFAEKRVDQCGRAYDNNDKEREAEKKQWLGSVSCGTNSLARTSRRLIRCFSQGSVTKYIHYVLLSLLASANLLLTLVLAIFGLSNVACSNSYLVRHRRRTHLSEEGPAYRGGGTTGYVVILLANTTC